MVEVGLGLEPLDVADGGGVAGVVGGGHVVDLVGGSETSAEHHGLRSESRGGSPRLESSEDTTTTQEKGIQVQDFGASAQNRGHGQGQGQGQGGIHVA